jgi:hypothetical protein
MKTSVKQTEIVAPKFDRRVYELPPEGPNLATLIHVEDLGIIPNNYGDEPKHTVLMTWETDATDSDGAPFRIFERVNLTLHRKGRLSSRIAALTGSVPPEDAPYPVHDLVGGRAMLVVQHRKTEKGTYANVIASFQEKPIRPQAGEAQARKVETAR